MEARKGALGAVILALLLCGGSADAESGGHLNAGWDTAPHQIAEEMMVSGARASHVLYEISQASYSRCLMPLFFLSEPLQSESSWKRESLARVRVKSKKTL